MLWHILKYYMGFVIGAYFKRYKIKNSHFINVKGPVIIAMNHPNGFMDPIAFTGLIYPPRVRYLARGDAFKKGIITTLLESLGIIPIFRIQDGGKEGLKKNDETYDRVNKLLKRNKKIIIFAEGLCIQERRLRPLKKGVPRMVFGAMDTYNLKDLTVVPVGLNYTNPSLFRSSLFINIGEPIKVIDYMQAYNEAPAKTMNLFLNDLAPKMKSLIVNINHKRSEKLVEYLEILYKSTFFKKEKLNYHNLEHDFLLSSKIVEIVNKNEEAKPDELRIIEQKASEYFTELKRYKIKNWLIIPENQTKINYFNFIFRLFVIVVTIPIYIVGVLGNYIPYKLTDIITTKKVRLIEFKSSFRIGIGAVLLLIYYCLQFFITSSLAPNTWWALLVITISALTGVFCINISPFRKKTWGILRVLKLKSVHPNTFVNLSKKREEIILLFEKL